MSGHIFAAEGSEAATVDLSGGNLTFVFVVGAIAVIALAMGMMFRREVLAAGEGTVLSIALTPDSRTLIAGYKCPRSIEFVDALPLSGAGKVLKRDLRAPFWEGRERNVN